jgi:hypothetical protein
MVRRYSRGNGRLDAGEMLHWIMPLIFVTGLDHRQLYAANAWSVDYCEK